MITHMHLKFLKLGKQSHHFIVSFISSHNYSCLYMYIYIKIQIVLINVINKYKIIIQCSCVIKSEMY